MDELTFTAPTPPPQPNLQHENCCHGKTDTRPTTADGTVTGQSCRYFKDSYGIFPRDSMLLVFRNFSLAFLSLI